MCSDWASACFVLGVDLERDKSFVHQPNDHRVRESSRVELDAVEAIIRAKIDDQRTVLLLGLLAGGVVVVTPLDFLGGSAKWGHQGEKQDRNEPRRPHSIAG